MMIANLLGLGRRSTLENPNVPLSSDADSLYDMLGAERSASGLRVNHKTALGYSPVWRAVTLIAGTVAKLPLNVYRRAEDDGREIDRLHPAHKLLRKVPNAEMRAFTFRMTLELHRLLQGNGYAWIRRAGSGDPLELIPLVPSETYPVRENGVLLYVTTVGEQAVKLSPINVLHIKGLSGDGLVGYSVVKTAADSLGLGMAAARYSSKFFANSAQPSVVIEYPGQLRDDQIEVLQKGWDSMHRGLDLSHRPAVLSGGAKLNAFSVNPEDAQLLESRQFEIREVANWFGLPPHKLGDTTRTAFASLEQENQSFLDDLDPWLVNWEEECAYKLLREREKENDTHFVEFNRNALVRADIKARYEAYAIGIGNAFLNPNEARVRENMNPYDGGDEFMKPLNMGAPGEDDESPAEEDDEPADEPAAEEDSDRASRLAEAHRRNLIETLAQMIRRVGVHARKAAKQQSTFCDWLDGKLKTDHWEAVQAAVARASEPIAIMDQFPPDEMAEALTARFFGTVDTRLASIPASPRAEVFLERVDRALDELERHAPAQLAAELLGGTSDDAGT